MKIIHNSNLENKQELIEEKKLLEKQLQEIKYVFYPKTSIQKKVKPLKWIHSKKSEIQPSPKHLISFVLNNDVKKYSVDFILN